MLLLNVLLGHPPTISLVTYLSLFNFIVPFSFSFYAQLVKLQNNVKKTVTILRSSTLTISTNGF